MRARAFRFIELPYGDAERPVIRQEIYARLSFRSCEIALLNALASLRVNYNLSPPP
jgi:hypothetical protein